MKKYTSRATKWLAIFVIISAVTLVIGVIHIVTNSSKIGLQIGATMLGGLMSILFLSCFLAEKSRYLTVNDGRIILSRGAAKNGKMSLHRTIINMGEISSIESKLYKGDGIISQDTYFHILSLKDGSKITFTLFVYGKKAEEEIVETIRKNIA